MSRYIDADKLKHQIERGAEMTEKGIRLLDLSQQPSADVAPVVRCKDCKWDKTSSCRMMHERAKEDYCSHGVRKD